jgi:hypothetical protein
MMTDGDLDRAARDHDRWESSVRAHLRLLDAVWLAGGFGFPGTTVLLGLAAPVYGVVCARARQAGHAPKSPSARARELLVPVLDLY